MMFFITNLYYELQGILNELVKQGYYIKIWSVRGIAPFVSIDKESHAPFGVLRWTLFQKNFCIL